MAVTHPNIAIEKKRPRFRECEVVIRPVIRKLLLSVEIKRSVIPKNNPKIVLKHRRYQSNPRVRVRNARSGRHVTLAAVVVRSAANGGRAERRADDVIRRRPPTQRLVIQIPLFDMRAVISELSRFLLTPQSHLIHFPDHDLAAELLSRYNS